MILSDMNACYAFGLPCEDGLPPLTVVKFETGKGRYLGRLFLLRHGKARWADPGMKDFDRTLDEKGVAEAIAMGKAMVARGLVPEKIICSNAVRAKQTLLYVNEALGLQDKTTFTDELYATDAPGYLEIAAKVTDVDDVMLVGHNPMLEDLAIGTAATGDQTEMYELQMGFRTAGLAVIAFDGPPVDFESLSGKLEAYLTPADL